MITLGKKLEILRLYFIEGKAKKQIARELNISKNTVKSYINEFLNSNTFNLIFIKYKQFLDFFERFYNFVLHFYNKI